MCYDIVIKTYLKTQLNINFLQKLCDLLFHQLQNIEICDASQHRQITKFSFPIIYYLLNTETILENLYVKIA